MRTTTLSRRGLLRSAAVGAAGLMGLGSRLPAGAPGRDAATQPRARAMAAELTKLSEHVFVYAGPINVGVVRRDLPQFTEAILVVSGGTK